MLSKLTQVFKKPPVHDVLKQQLDEAERELIQAKAEEERARHTVQMFEARVARLRREANVTVVMQ